MSFEFHTTLRDEQVLVVVTHYVAPKPMKIIGSGYGDALPPEEMEFEFYLEPAMELTQEESDQVLEDFFLMDKANDHGY